MSTVKASKCLKLYVVFAVFLQGLVAVQWAASRGPVTLLGGTDEREQDRPLKTTRKQIRIPYSLVLQ